MVKALPKLTSKLFVLFLLEFVFLLFSFVTPKKLFAVTFNIPDNDSLSLINAINEATSSGEPSIINLANNGSYLLSTKFSSVYGDNGLPLIISNITINGNGAKIYREISASRFRIFALISPGKLTINNLKIEGGFSTDRGGAIYNLGGTLEISDSIITLNTALSGGVQAFGIKMETQQ